MSFSPLRRGALVAMVFVCSATASALGEIRWRSAAPDLPAPRAADDIDAAILQAAGPQAQRRIVVRLVAPPDAGIRAALAGSGVTLLSYLGENAFFASVSAVDLDPAGLGAIDTVGMVQRPHKLHPLLAAGARPDHAVVGLAGGEEILAVYVIFHPDVALDDGVAVVLQHGAAVRDRLESVNGLVIEIVGAQMDPLADRDEVQWIEPALPRLSTTNAENRALTQADVVQQAPYGLDGTGVVVLIYDGGDALASHTDFSGRLTVIDSAPISDHSTHVAGTVGGDGSLTLDNRGMAPNTTLLSAGFQYDGSGTFLYTNPGDLEADYGTGLSMGAVLTNNSIGSNVEPNGFPCAYQGDYGVTSSVIDAVVRGSLGDPLIVVWANGNERQGSSCDIEGFGDYYSIAPPAGAKNHITVGALNANDDSMTSFSSWGPTDDGRMKPDIAAPGCQSDGDLGVTSCSSSGTYTVKCGTSMASPTVCGLTALLLQDFRAQFPGLPDPLASTVKVILAQTAVDLGNTGPDYQTGYGSVRIRDAIDFMRTAQFTEQSIDQGGFQSFDIDVSAGEPVLKFTLAWSDPPGTPNVNPNLVNDLDLVVTDPIGGTHHPWTLDPQNPGDPAVQTGPNTLDNLEQVLVNNPMAGTWTVTVEGTSVPQGPQSYSLAGSPNLDVSFVSVGITSSVPTLVPPGDPVNLDVSVTAVNDTIVSGSEKLYYRFDGGSYVETALVPNGPDYVATIPGAACADAPEFYLGIEGLQSGVILNPPAGPAAPYAYGIGVIEQLFNDDFEADLGWTVANSGTLTDGSWERAVPIPLTTCDRGNPGTDADGSGQCYLTDNSSADACNSDVDSGTTTLTSPTLDASGDDVVLSYWRWFSNNTGGGPESDTLLVEVSDDDGGSWSVLETVGPAGPGVGGGWFLKEFNLDDVAGFTPNTQFRIRFTAEDVDPQSVVEAAVDGITFSRQACVDVQPPCPDINGDNMVGVQDLLAMLGAWGVCGACPEDVDGDGDVDIEDLLALLAAWGPCPLS